MGDIGASVRLPRAKGKRVAADRRNHRVRDSSFRCQRRDATIWRVGVGATDDAEKRIAKAIAAAAQRHRLALRQRVETAGERAANDVPAAVLVRMRRSRGRGGNERQRASAATEVTIGSKHLLMSIFLRVGSSGKFEKLAALPQGGL